MGFAKKAILAGCAGFAVALIVGCGSSGSLLSIGQAGGLKTKLAEASAALNDLECRSAQNDLKSFRQDVNALSGVNSTLISNLYQGESTIAQLAERKCPTHHPHKSKTRTVTTVTTVTSPATTVNTNTQTTTTNTQPTVTGPQTGTGTTPATGGTGVSYRHARRGSGRRLV